MTFAKPNLPALIAEFEDLIATLKINENQDEK